MGKCAFLDFSNRGAMASSCSSNAELLKPVRLARTSGAPSPACVAEALDQEAINRCMQKLGVKRCSEAGFNMDDAAKALVAMLIFKAPGAEAARRAYADDGESTTSMVFIGLVFIVGMFFSAVGGLLFGAVTGGVLVRQFGETKPEARHERKDKETQNKETQTSEIARASVGSQSPVTYSRWRQQPRFQPLPWSAWG